MILSRRATLPDGKSFGDDVTLDALLLRHAAARPGGRAIADPADRPVFTDGRPRRMNWGVLNEEVERLATGLRALGLGRDSAVAIQMPNTTESVVSLLAVLRAGYVATLIPLAWRKREISEAFTRLGVKAAITVSRAGPARHAEIMCEAAADAFSVRFIMAFGRDVPDGVISIDDQLAELVGADLEPLAERAGRPGQHLAVITWDACAAGFVPVARSHCELLAAGLVHLLEAGLDGDDVIATTLLGSSLAGLSTGLLASLLSSAPLVLHQPFSSRALAGALATEGVTHLIIPGATVAGMARAGRIPMRPLRSVGAVWRTGERPGRIPTFPAVPAIIDVMSFGEIGLAAAWRDSDLHAAPLPLGPMTAPRSDPDGPSLIETKVMANGRLLLRGAMSPSANLPSAAGLPVLTIDPDGWVDTGLAAGVSGAEVRIGAGRAGVARIGGLSLPRDRTEQDLADLSAETGAQVSLQIDPLFGEAIQADGGSQSAVSRAVDARGTTPALSPRPDRPDRAQVA